jgi:Rrf2 family cysteine metabolism transcriptional repressor
MKLGTKTRYSARAMLDLALNYDKGSKAVSAREIAERQEVSLKYLENLLAALNSAGLVRSIRGPEGGHLLARPPAQINLREIYQVFEGTEGFVECTTDPEYCRRTDNCATQEIWAQMYDACMKILESTTLEDLARRVRAKQGDSAMTWYFEQVVPWHVGTGLTGTEEVRDLRAERQIGDRKGVSE